MQWPQEQGEFHRRVFELRMQRSRDDLFGMLDRLYGRHPAYAPFCNALTAELTRAFAARPEALKWLDLKRDLEPDWFQRPGMAGYVFYLDRFNGGLRGVLDKLDYLERLGITYVHFMPCLKPRPGDSDGGYSVMDYRAINPAYGTMQDFEAVATALRGRGISLCIDLVLQPYRQGARLGASRAGRRPRVSGLLPDVRRRHAAEAIRADPDRSLPRQRAGQLHPVPRLGRTANGCGPPSTSTSGI